MRAVLLSLLTLSLIVTGALSAQAQTKKKKEKPLMKDFIGLNGHYHYKPELYKQVGRLVRNYHNINWDVSAVGAQHNIPKCPNGVNWQTVYGKWVAHDIEIDLCLQFSGYGHKMKDYKKVWSDNLEWSYGYAKAVAAYFGPSNKNLATSIEIGNEPGQRFDDAVFRKVFINMAKGLRAGDPKVKIVTPTAHAHKADDYSKDLRVSFADEEIKALYDVINVHTYAQIPRKNNSESPWNRTFPEDYSVPYLKVVDDTIAWRDKEAKDKEIWVTEFGYDSVTPDAMKERKGWMLKLNWQGYNDLQQAQYIVRSFFLLAERDIDRAYLYFFNDSNKPGVHSGGGITRNFKPKMSFWAVKQMYELLGDYRFHKVRLKKDGEVYAYEFKHATNPKLSTWVVWSPTGTQTHKKDNYTPRTAEVTLTGIPGKVCAAWAMATTNENTNLVPVKPKGLGKVSLTIGESPTYLLIEK